MGQLAIRLRVAVRIETVLEVAHAPHRLIAQALTPLRRPVRRGKADRVQQYETGHPRGVAGGVEQGELAAPRVTADDPAVVTPMAAQAVQIAQEVSDSVGRADRRPTAATLVVAVDGDEVLHHPGHRL